jgi:hypothetical protein
MLCQWIKGKSVVILGTISWKLIRGMEVKLHILTSALEGGKWWFSIPGRITFRENVLSIHWIGGWMDPRTFPGKVVAMRKVPVGGKHFPIPSPHCKFMWRIGCSPHWNCLQISPPPPWSRIILERLTVTQPVKKFPEDSLPCSQETATESSTHISTLIP